MYNSSKSKTTKMIVTHKDVSLKDTSTKFNKVSNRNITNLKTHSKKIDLRIKGNSEKKFIETSFDSKIKIFKNKIKGLRELQKYGFFQKCFTPKFKISQIGRICKIHYDYKNQIIDTSEFNKCGLNNCYYCQPHKNIEQKNILNEVIKEYTNDSSKGLFLLTLDFNHYKNMSLEHLFFILKQSIQDTFKDSRFIYNKTKFNSKTTRSNNSISYDIGFTGSYLKYEINYSVVNGYHAHVHILITSNKPNLEESFVKSIEARTRDIFTSYVASYMKELYPTQTNILQNESIKLYSTDLKEITHNSFSIGFYLNKHLNSVSNELSNTESKYKTKLDTSHTLKHLYEMLINNDYSVIKKPLLIQIIRDFTTVTKGKSLNHWKLIKDTKINEIRKSVEESNKSSKKSYVESLKNSRRISAYYEELRDRLNTKKILNIIESNLLHDTPSNKPSNGIISRVNINVYKNRRNNNISLNRRVLRLNRAIVLNTRNQEINIKQKLASNTVIASNTRIYLMNSS